MKKMITVIMVSMFVIFTACVGGSGGDSNGGGNEPTEVCGNGTCGNGETHESCPADCRCGNGVCDAKETAHSCPKDCGCTDANNNHVCDNQERIAKYCYDHAQLDVIYGDTIHYGQFSSPNPTLGWDADNDVIQFLLGDSTVCFTSKAWPIVEHGYESLYCDATAGKMAADKWISYNVAPKSIEVTVGDTTTTRPVLPYFSGMGYHTCLDEEAPLCWVNLCTISSSGVMTCYNEVGDVDNACGVTKECQLCVEHCKQLYDILLP